MANKESFDVRLKEWESMHPRQWVATTDRSQLATFLSEQTPKYFEAQLELADRIVVSQEGIEREVNSIKAEIKEGLSSIEVGVKDLRATFEWGFSELIWRLEQEDEQLREILDTLQASLDTDARKLRNRAEKAYQNEWVVKALEDFLESEKRNSCDFTVHFYLGNIYLFHKGNAGKALEYYEKAVKYAPSEVPYYAAFALLHVGLVKYLQTDFQAAYDATQKAIELYPNLYEAHYQHARYCSKLEKHGEALRHLSIAIKGDKYYCVKASIEKDFRDLTSDLGAFLKEVFANTYDQAKSSVKEAAQFIEKTERDEACHLYFVEKWFYAPKYVAACWDSTPSLSEAKENLGVARDYLARESILDSWASLLMARECIGTLSGHLDRFIKLANDFFDVQGNRLRLYHIRVWGWILAALGIIVGVIIAYMLTGVFWGGSLEWGRMASFVLALLFFSTGFCVLLWRVGTKLGEVFIYPRRRKAIFTREKCRLIHLERVKLLLAKSESKSVSWEDTLKGL
jgi:tetratricopeptide (TPR) repeat protein